MVVKLLSENIIPAEPGVIFTRPVYEKWMQILESNQQVLCNLADRNTCRAELVNAAVCYSRDILGTGDIDYGDFGHIVVTGHQPIWHHCGIAAKGFIASELARRAGGVAVWLVLDHDICDTAMIVPGADGLKIVEISTNHEDVPSELRGSPSDEQIRYFADSVKDLAKGSLVSRFFYEKKLSSYKNIADFITYLEAAVYDAVSIRMVYLPVSLMSHCRVFFDFAAGIIKMAAEFAAVYNEAIESRIGKGDSGRGFLRKLKIDADGKLVEFPFWVISRAGGRSSVYVRPENNGRISIFAGDEKIEILSAGSVSDISRELEITLACFGYKLRPKAVTLTLFVRLYLADMFVHGVGGENYEFVTSALLEKFYAVKGTEYGVATGTMRFGCGGALPRGFEDVDQLRRQVRQLQCNPENFIPLQRLFEPVVQSLIGQKRSAVEQANEKEMSRKHRKCAWEAISHINDELLHYCEDLQRDLLCRIEQCEKHERESEVLNYREFFFGLFGKDQLKEFFYGREEK